MDSKVVCEVVCPKKNLTKKQVAAFAKRIKEQYSVHMYGQFNVFNRFFDVCKVKSKIEVRSVSHLCA